MDRRSHGSPPSRGFLLVLISAGLGLGALVTSSQAQGTSAIRPDGTLGTVVTQRGNVHTITGGTRPGNGPNLFHSFDRFSVGTGDTASFSGPTGIANILSRVTGGQQSLIDGKLQSTIPGANLYLLNPSGFLFGRNATLDISGSFHVSTADYLRLADGAQFHADLGQASTLTVAPPAAFGFLGRNPAGIAVQGSALQVAGGQAVSVVGGDIQLVGGILVAPRGRIQLASAASPGEVQFSPLDLAPELQVDSLTRLGRLELTQGAILSVSGNGGGTVILRGGRLQVDDSAMFADNTGPLPGTGVGLDLRITEDAIMANGAFLTTDSLGAGQARNLRLTAGRVQLDKSGVFSRSIASGDGGAVTLHVGTLTLTGGAQLSTSTRGTGRGGPLTVAATEAIAIGGLNSGLLSNAFNLGDAGEIVVLAPAVTMDKGLIQAQASSESRGNAGGINMRVGRLTLTGGAQLSTSTRGTGRGGPLTVAATEAIAISGSGSGLFSNTQSRGPGGSLDVQARSIALRDQGTIAARSAGDGAAGNIQLQADETFRSDHGHVTTTADQAGGGTIALRAGRLVQLRESEVTTSVRGGGGDAGNLTVEAPFIVAGGSQLVANAFGGSGGNIRINAGVFLADPESRVSASSAQGIRGTVDIRAPVTTLSGVVSPLPPEFAPAPALLRDRCAARLREGTVSSFVERGRDDVPATPDGVLPSRLASESADAASATAVAPVARQGGLHPDDPRPRQARRHPAPPRAARAQPPDCTAP